MNALPVFDASSLQQRLWLGLPTPTVVKRLIVKIDTNSADGSVRHLAQAQTALLVEQQKIAGLAGIVQWNAQTRGKLRQGNVRRGIRIGEPDGKRTAHQGRRTR